MAGSLTLTPAQRTLRARAAAFAMHSQGKTNTKAATAASQGRFERQVDPEGVLSPAERARRADHARKAYMATLSLKASRAKTQKAAAPSDVRAAADVGGGQSRATSTR